MIQDIKNCVLERKRFLSKLIQTKRTALKEAPDGYLRVSPRGKAVHFYHVTQDTGSNGKYLRKNQNDFAYALAQKAYDQITLETAEKEFASLESLDLLYESGQIPENVYLKAPAIRQSMITPVEMTDEMFVTNWRSQPYEKLDYPKPSCYFSDDNEQMRSKSEVIIANMLKKYNVPYRYECALRINGNTFFPDFTILNVNKRKELYWEHFGMLDDVEYLDKNLVKLSTYIMNDISPGDRLIISFESTKQPLNMKLLRRIIEKNCF